MKRLIFAFAVFLSQIFYSQMDTEHWIAPIYDINGVPKAAYLYLSTNQTTSFPVSVYSGGTLFTTVNISKGNPSVINIPEDLMFSSSTSEVLTPIKKGLFITGDNQFFANFRFEIDNHGEFVTSKGKAGLGTLFYSVNTPLARTQNDFDFTTGIIATENNTTVTVSGYNPSVLLIGITSTTPTSFTVKLNKGESYLIAGSGTIIANRDGFIGAKIESDKAVAVVNGNMNGNVGYIANGSRDIYMDESVPVERLGTDFVVVKGNGPIGSKMERPMVVATEDNTQVFINDATTAYTFTDAFGNSKSTLNHGEYGLIADSQYINQGDTMYNMAIKSTKKIYVYQNLAGISTGNPLATGGFNYIPPLSCFLPNKIDEIPFIDQIGNDVFDTKINIITEKGATVTYNGMVLSGAAGPYPVTGNTAWETYQVIGATGSATIKSTRSLTAGIAAGSGAVGYGGYFAGFNSVPVISKGGDCETGFYLEVDNSYDTYQWYYNGAPIAGATQYKIFPTESGNYSVEISKKDCGSITTPVYVYVACAVQSIQNYTIGSCNTIKIQPKFTKSTQNLVISSIKIIKQPINGTATINATTGEITYTVTSDTATSDVFKYTFSGDNATLPDAEIVTVNITIVPLLVYNGVSKACVNSGTGHFNIDDVKLTDDASAAYRYFKTLAAANSLDTTQEITTLHPYPSPAGTIYVRITDQYGCYKIAEIELKDSQPNVNPDNYDSYYCDDDLDGKIDIKFSDITPIIVKDYQDFTVQYFDNAAFSGNPLADDWSYTADTDIYVRVFSLTSCVTATGIIHFKFGNKISATDTTQIICDGDFNNTENVNLNSYVGNVTAEQGTTPTFYKTKIDAGNKTNEISASQTIKQNTTFYVRLEKAGICPNVSAINLIFNQPKKSTSLVDQTICEGTTTELDAGTGIDSYLWSTGETTRKIIVGPGNYYVDLTYNSCVYRQSVVVSSSPKPIFTLSSFNGSHCDDDFDGEIKVDLSTITPTVISNYTLFKIRYYANLADANVGNTNTLPINWTYSSDTTIYIRTDSNYCPFDIQPLDFKIGNKLPLISSAPTTEICDDDLDGKKSVDLSSFKTLFNTDPSVTVAYFNTLADAKANTNAILSTQTTSGTQNYYFRFSQAGICPNIGQLTIITKAPKASTTLIDKAICPSTTTILDAGTGFDAYLWSTGETSESIAVKAGTYWVQLTTNGCPYKQYVNVTEVELPKITAIDIQGTTVTVSATGGNEPYQYSIDGINYQTSNIFKGVSQGEHTIYVISADNCTAVQQDFVVIGIVNVITPNNDGSNDTLDFSVLSRKSEVKFSVFDRYGKKLFEGTPTNEYNWDGKVNGRPIPTGTYWYILEWKEFGVTTKTTYGGWVLVKNN